MQKSENKQLTPALIIRVLEQNSHHLKSLGVKKIGLFGSFLKGRATVKSDLDFLVSFEKPTFDNFMETKFFLEKLFKRKIDLVTEQALKPALKNVQKEVLYAKAL